MRIRAREVCLTRSATQDTLLQGQRRYQERVIYQYYCRLGVGNMFKDRIIL
jgi:hypothetical protein